MASPDPSGPSRLPIGAVAFILILAAGLPVFDHDLWNPDEPRLAHIARVMLRDGDWVLPRVNGEPFVEQPPLQAWLAALCMAVLGSGFGRDWVPRLPSLGFSLALLFLVYRTGTRLRGRETGAAAALMLATTIEFGSASHRAVVDTALAFLTALAMVQLLEAARRGEEVSWARALGLGAALGGSFLAKNLVGIAFAGLVGAALACRCPRVFLRPRALGRLLAGGALAALIALPWLWALGRRDPELLRQLLVDNTLGRFLRDDIKNPPILEFLHRAPGALCPWLLLALPLAWRALRGALAPRSVVPARRIPIGEEALLWWIALPFLLVLASGSKREIYLLPLTPAVALAAASELDRIVGMPAVRRAAGGLAALLGLAVPLLALFGGIWAGPMPWPVWVLLAAHLAVLIRSLRAGWWASPRHLTLLALMLAATAWGSGAAVHYRLENPRESYVPLSRDLAALGERGFEIIGFDLPLRDKSAIPYYLDRRIPILQDAEAARARFEDAARPAAMVFRAGSREELLDRFPWLRDASLLEERTVRRPIFIAANPKARGG